MANEHQKDDLFSPPLHVQPPECDCHGKAECEHESVLIVCTDCGGELKAGKDHCCVQLDGFERKRFQKIERVARAVVRAHGDNARSEFFFDLMIDLARALE